MATDKALILQTQSAAKGVHVADTPVSYALWEEAFARFDQRLAELVKDARPDRVCEIGGGAHPSISLDAAKQLGFQYVVLDVSQEQLDKAPAGYDKVVCDISARDLQLQAGYDLMFSRMLAEHVPDGGQFHRNVLALLNPGGAVMHFMPTLFSVPFLINRLIPEWLSGLVWNLIRTRDKAKFPGYYHWCFGPTKTMIRRFREMGYEIVEYKGFFGHGYYRRLGFLHAMQLLLARFLVRHPSPHLTSYVWLLMRKPQASR